MIRVMDPALGSVARRRRLSLPRDRSTHGRGADSSRKQSCRFRAESSARSNASLAPPSSQTRVSPSDRARATRRKRYRPGELVGIDCFFVGRLYGAKGPVWQITAIDTYSSFAWADLVVTPAAGRTVVQTSGARPPRRPRAPGRWLAARARPHRQRQRVRPTGIRLPTARRRLPHPDPLRPAADQRPRRTAPRTILEECWRPAFARFLQVRSGGYDATSTTTSTTTTSTADTTDERRPGDARPTSSTVPTRGRRDEPHLSAQLGVCSAYGRAHDRGRRGPTRAKGSRPRRFRRPHG
jgi:hypothetical protein